MPMPTSGKVWFFLVWYESSISSALEEAVRAGEGPEGGPISGLKEGGPLHSQGRKPLGIYVVPSLGLRGGGQTKLPRLGAKAHLDPVTRHLSGLAADRFSTFFLLAAALFLHFSILFTLFLSFILLPNERVGRPLPKKKKRRSGFFCCFFFFFFFTSPNHL